MPNVDIEYIEPCTKDSWTNKNNITFYEEMTDELYGKLLKNSGIDINQDIHGIKEYILNAQSIFEIGLCRGRVVKACREIGYRGKFSGIEFTPNFCKELKSNFTDLTLFEGDFLEFIAKEQYDVVMLMGSTLSAFIFDEQKKCFSKVKEILKPNGFLIIDNYLAHRKPENNGSLPASNHGFYTFQANGECHGGYIPSIEEINNMAQEIGLEIERESQYAAGNDIMRISLIYKLPNVALKMRVGEI
jgi:SAM-dependent methyltransferase